MSGLPWYVAILTKSKSLKRKIASYLSVLLELVRPIPELAFVVPTVEMLAGAFGVVGITHAAGGGTVKTYKVLSLGALFSVLVAAAHVIPQLAPALPILIKLAALFGAVGFGQNLAKTK